MRGDNAALAGETCLYLSVYSQLQRQLLFTAKKNKKHPWLNVTSWLIKIKRNMSSFGFIDDNMGAFCYATVAVAVKNQQFGK